jgi:SAM-dependent methyltransferase
MQDFMVKAGKVDLIPCPLCAGSRTHVVRKTDVAKTLAPEDFQITDAHYGRTLSLCRCDDCSFVFADPAELQQLEKLYGDLEDPGYVGTQDSRSLQMKWLVDVILQVKPAAKTLLDVGAGTGLLVREAEGRGIRATGVEPSRWLVKNAWQTNGVTILNGVIPHGELSGKQFDVVTAIDVIEHVRDPISFLAACRSYLAPGGLVAIVTPDRRSLAARFLGYSWWHYRIGHVGYFDRTTLCKLFTRCDLAPLYWTRAIWFFRLKYLAERAGNYLPMINGVFNKRQMLRLQERIIRVNLHDSLLVMAQPTES